MKRTERVPPAVSEREEKPVRISLLRPSQEEGEEGGGGGEGGRGGGAGG